MWAGALAPLPPVCVRRQRLAALGYDAGAAERLEEDAEKARLEARQWKDRVDELSSQLAGGCWWCWVLGRCA